MTDIRVAIIEDNKGIRESLGMLIGGSPGFIHVCSCSSAEEALATIPGVLVDVVLMDINLPQMNGIACTLKLKEQHPNIQIIMQTVYENSEMIFESLKAGASGYILKRTSPSKLLEAIEDAYNGGSPMSSQIARMVVASFYQSAKGIQSQSNLTSRESEILALLAKGFKYREISDQLYISHETVRSHVRNIYEKLHVRSKTEAVIKYLQK